jgi:signal transduction histidine kinase
MENQNDKAAFFGKIAASATHEIQNVLAIIKENAGLMEDILLINHSGDLSDIEEKLGQCIKSIKNQGYRGVGLTSELNSFAHTTDNTRISVNILELTKKLISITERLFRQKGVEISIIESGKPYSVIIDPLFFQMVAFSCIEHLVENFETDAPVAISIKFADDPTAILFLYNDKNEKIINGGQWEKIVSLCKQANFKAEIQIDTPGIIITFE